MPPFLPLYASPHRDRTTSEWYWVAQVVSAHQYIRSSDGDPDSCYHIHSTTLGDYKEGDSSTLGAAIWPEGGGSSKNIAAIYVETIRDAVFQAAELNTWGFSLQFYPVLDTVTALQVEQAAVIHEVGHLFGCDHDYGIMLPGGSNPEFQFTGTSLNTIRTESHIEQP